MAALHEALRRELAKRIVEARAVAEEGAAAALARLAVGDREPHPHLSADERVLRNRLRARARALGGRLRPNGVQELDRLQEEVAYEHWHRMLFARFLAENGLLVHPVHGVAVTLAECEELAAEEGAEDQWVLASRYAARMLPQIFRPEDPALALAFAPEHRVALERLLAELPRDVFLADDALGWVYQYWQAKRKDEVNAAGEPISAETLPAVTQLFTEPYMVSFLLENTIGAWWLGRHPGQEPPVAMPYLRHLDDGTPAAGTFADWPQTWREFTMLDPCCGSGHFLVAALRLLVPLRMHDEGLSAADAVDAVLRENLHGLELDARCTQIGAFAVALAAWTTQGATGYRPLPELQIACSGMPVAAKREEWVALADGDQRVGAALGRLHELFRLAPELGSLIDPTEGREDLLTAGFVEVAPLMERALASRVHARDEDRQANAIAAKGAARAATMLSRTYTLVATNVPYLGWRDQGGTLQEFVNERYALAKYDLATVFLLRIRILLNANGTYALVLPQNWLFLRSYARFREMLLSSDEWSSLAQLGPRAFDTITGEVVKAVLFIASKRRPAKGRDFVAVDASEAKRAHDKSTVLRQDAVVRLLQAQQLRNPDARVVFGNLTDAPLLEVYASSYAGILNGDSPRFQRMFWEFGEKPPEWVYQQTTTEGTKRFGGRHLVIYFDEEGGHLRETAEYRRERLHDSDRRGNLAWNKWGVAVNQMGDLSASLYSGDKFDSNIAVIVPNDQRHVPALWEYCQSEEFRSAVRMIDKKMNVTNASFAKVPFDLEAWTEKAKSSLESLAASVGSPDPTQWVFDAEIRSALRPLHVAVAQMLGYQWPGQASGAHLAGLVDADGIVCLPPVRGEQAAEDRLQAFLAAAYSGDWTAQAREGVLADADFSGKTLGQWLRDGFFAQHCNLFHHRPFVWQVWDGLKDGFSALLNYHKLSKATLESLAYTYLGDWIARQDEARRRNERGADVRLAKAKELQAKLVAIIEGEPPYDIFVRWKQPPEQPIGWDPDLNDGVRLNIWPFVQAGVLRAKVNVNWKKDRGKNPDGSPWGPDRHNRFEDIPRDERPADLRDVEHLTIAVKRRLRAAAAKATATGPDASKRGPR